MLRTGQRLITCFLLLLFASACGVALIWQVERGPSSVVVGESSEVSSLSRMTGPNPTTTRVKGTAPVVSPSRATPSVTIRSSDAPQTVAVMPPASPTPRRPSVVTFTVDIVPETAGDTVSLRWRTRGNAEITICPMVDGRDISCRCLWGLPSAGAHTLAAAEIVAAYTGFSLRVNDPKGCSARECVTRVVQTAVRCPTLTPGTETVPGWFFEPEPEICPEAPAITSTAAQQAFEHGTMIWLEVQDTYYVFYDRFLPPSGVDPVMATLTSADILRGPLDLLPQASQDNANADVRVAESPPDGRVEPVSGFGLIWRGEVAGSSGIRQRLGWALEPERGFQTRLQCGRTL